jgi:predicted RNase H-like HicB family nuclease
MSNTFTAVFYKTGGWFTASILEVQGINTQGKTLDEARDNLQYAIIDFLEATREYQRKEIPPSSEYTLEEVSVTV